MRHPRYKDPSRNRHWKLWNRFASRFGQDPYLSRIQGATHHLERSLLFMAFALALRNGELDGKGPAKGSEITEALRYCGLCMVAYGYADPRRADIGQRNLDHTIAHHLQRWRDADPAPKPQQALPNTAVAWIAQHYCASDSRMISASGHLIILAYFFLLRIGEYTKSSDQATRRTIPLRKGDVRLWSGTTELCRDAPLAVLLTADAVTICLANQKNGDKNSTLHHHKSTLALDPVESAAHLIHAMQNMPNDTPLGTYRTVEGRTGQVSSDAIRAAIRHSATMCHLPAQGFDLDRIGSHSLRAGGAVMLKLCGYDSDMIKKLGRWRSDTYLRYIQTQIANLTAGVATAMARRLHFHNVS